MTDFQAVADRVAIEALRGEFTDAAMMRDRARLASLFTPDGVLRMPNVGVELNGPEEIRSGAERFQAQWDFFVQNTHPGSIEIDGDTAHGRAYIHEIARLRDGREGLNHAIYHDRYRRTPDGWRFTERVYEVRYCDISPLSGSAPPEAGSTGRRSPQAGIPHATPEASMTSAAPLTRFTDPASADRLERAATALAAHNFAVEILGDAAAAARTRVKQLIPETASVFTTSSETLRLSGIDADINTSGRHRAVKPRTLRMDRASEADEFRRLVATPDVVVGSVAAVTETGSLVVASATGSQLPAYVGGAGRAIWIAGAQKVVPDLDAALRRVEEHALPLESARAQAAYGQPSAINQLLVLNAAPRLGEGIVLLLREAIGF